MNTTKKKIVIAIAIIIAIVGIGSFGYIQFQNQKQLAVDFLVGKYDFNRTDIEILDFEIEHYYIGYQDVFCDWYYIDKANNKWSIEYKGNQFFVNDIDGRLYDDYQLEDVENWCIEWFKENIDDRITCIPIDSLSLVEYQKFHANNGNMYIFKKEDIFDFLISNSVGAKSFITTEPVDLQSMAMIYFYTPNATEKEIEKLQNDIYEKIANSLNGFKFFKPDYIEEKVKIKSFNDSKLYWIKTADAIYF